MKLFVKKKFLEIFIPTFVMLFLFIAAIACFIYSDQRKRVINSIAEYQSDFLLQRSELIRATLAPTIADLSSLSRLHSVIGYLNDPSDKSQLIEDMQLFARHNWNYRQIRFIDTSGIEKIRINWENNRLVIVPDSLLQNKSSRPFFNETMKLAPGEIYISPIDLNIEHGKIEIPYQRVIRYATPIYNKHDSLTGMIVINQYLNNFFRRLGGYDSNRVSSFTWLNSDGYWLMGPKKYMGFGFMFKEHEPEKFSTFFPDIWEKITAQDHGYFNEKRGICVFRHLSLNSDMAAIAQPPWGNVRVDKSNNWLLVVFQKKTDIPQLTDIRRIFILSIVATVLFLFFISDMITRLRLKEKRYIEELNILNHTLERKIEQRTLELSLKNEQLKVVNDELEAFSYSVSHDLRAPLRHISGFVDLLVKKNQHELSGKGPLYMRYIREATLEMNTLIDDLLNFSRLGRTTLNYTSFKMNVLVEEVKDVLERDFAGRQIFWNIPDLARVTGDYSLLRQVWINLLHNAVKYSSKQELIRIEIASCETSGQTVFSVKDYGIGFDMRYSHKLFGTFQRLHSGEDYEGTGIGLAIVRRVITRHGGQTWAEGAVGKGATFYFSLPHVQNQ